jgi:hypothetical protein
MQHTCDKREVCIIFKSVIEKGRPRGRLGADGNILLK